MDKKSNKQDKPEKKNTAISEQAINKKEVDGRDINHQEKNRREKHQPRDNA
jgi:hypothetical protein